MRKPKTIKSLALPTDSHLVRFSKKIIIVDEKIIIKSSKDFAYLDYEIVSGGAIFFFIEREKFETNKYTSNDIYEIYSEFELQRVYKNFFDGKKVILSRQYKLIDNDHEKFDLESGLKDAEFKAIEYMISK